MRNIVALLVVAILVCCAQIQIAHAASWRSENFVAHAPHKQIAINVCTIAEKTRKRMAKFWLGRELPKWRERCPIYVTVNLSGPSGATSFTFGRGVVTSRRMQVQGPLDRLYASVVPHEVTHTVFADFFGSPVPRWADEGGCIMTEDDLELYRHDKLTRQILNANNQFGCRTLFGLREYPRGKVMHLYAQGYSVTNWLVAHQDKHRGPKVFMRFVLDGMHRGWDQASQSHYGFRSVEELENAWLKHLRDVKGQDHVRIARQGLDRFV